MHRLRHRLSLSVLALAGLSACGDSSGPDDADRTADQLEALAESLGDAGDIVTFAALMSASDAVRSGASPRSITLTVDGASGTWTGVSTRTTLSETACLQLLDRLVGLPELPDASEFCAPTQMTIAWKGAVPEASHVIAFLGDTGAVDLGFSEFIEPFDGDAQYGAGVALMRRLSPDAMWISDSGQASSIQQSIGGDCPRRQGRGLPIELECRLARYQVGIGARMFELETGPYGPFIPNVPPEEEPTAMTRISMSAQSLDGMLVHVIRYPDLDVRNVEALRTMVRQGRQPAAITAASRYLAR